MSRIALCFYGKFRDAQKSLAPWKKFMTAYKADVFIHTWGDTPILEGCLNEDPYTQSIKIDKDIDFKSLHPGIDQYSSSALNVLPQMYSIRQSDVLRTDYEDTLGFNYDWVVRSRFDLSLHEPDSIPFDTFDPKKLHVCDNHWGNSPGTYDDNIMIGSSQMMSWVSPMLYLHSLCMIHSNKSIPSGEQAMSAYLNEKGLPVVKHPSLNFTLARNL